MVQVKAAEPLRFPHPIHADIRACIDRGLADLVDPGLSLSARLALVNHPQTFTAPPIEIQVKPLPAPPADFTGLVGSFSMSSSLSKDSVGLGETTNLKIEISGKGNLREANLPDLKDLDYFKVYPSKPEVKLDRSIQGLAGRKVFEDVALSDQFIDFLTPSAYEFIN